MTHASEEGIARLAAMLRQVAIGADELIAAVRKDGGERYVASVKRLERHLERTQADLAELQAGIAARARFSLRSMDQAARDYPYVAAGAGVVMGAALGVLIGLALGRR